MHNNALKTNCNESTHSAIAFKKRTVSSILDRSHLELRTDRHAAPFEAWCNAGAEISAALITAALAADLLFKDPADLEQVAWSCYWAAAAAMIGIFVHSDLLVSAALLFFIGLGSPAWIIGRLVEHEIDPTSVLIHTIPPIAGLLYLLGGGGFSRHAVLGAWSLHAFPLAFAHFFCDPAKNINLASRVWPPLAHFIPELWQFHALSLALSAAMFALMARIIRRWLAHEIRTNPLRFDYAKR